ncbi:MAG: metal-dependent hydrolase [Bacteroidetes bacterium]|nr:metal-dependent hydrolase [Bacteroidota bacterium]MBS1973376.1 metal-dependent hydrolase [Bacteroidota bacterium]
MDSLTHIALGACMGEAFFEKGFGKKAMAWGALAQSIPDIDFVASFWLSTPENLLAHRGFTHSVLFGLMIVPVFALLADRLHRPHNIAFRTWITFFAAEVFFHLFIDGFNNYGVGWLEPFSHARYSFNTIYVADPFFSLWPGIACVALIFLKSNSHKRTFWWKFGLIIPFVYLSYCCFNKFKTDQEVKGIFEKEHIPHQKYFTTPTPLQNWLWYVVSGNDTGYYVGFRSVFDHEKKMSFQYFPKNDSLLKPIGHIEDLQKLIRFSQQFYTIERMHDTLIFNDLRFGQVIGWEDPHEQFVFHYYLQYPEENKLVVQRGRFEKWNWETLKSLWQHIKGN